MHLSFSSGVGLLPETFFKTLSYTWHPTSPYTPITFGWPHTIPHDVSSIMFSLVIQSETWPSSNCKTMEAIPNFSTETTARSKLIQRASKFNLKVFFSICDHEVVFCTLDAMPNIFSIISSECLFDVKLLLYKTKIVTIPRIEKTTDQTQVC